MDRVAWQATVYRTAKESDTTEPLTVPWKAQRACGLPTLELHPMSLSSRSLISQLKTRVL